MVKLAEKRDLAQRQLQLKVTLKDIRPAIWRRLLVPASITLPKFHQVLQIVFEWTDSHLHAFKLKDESFEADAPDTPTGPAGPRHESNFRLSNLLHAEGDRLVYEYDFGDSWLHEVEVEKILAVSSPTRPSCVTGARAAPPEDCGGVPGYHNLVEAMADPHHPEHRNLINWLGRRYDSESFDLAAIDSALKSLKA